jgi:O-antigen/teichoic acid export membrane protein
MSRVALHASGTVVVAHASTTFLPVVVFAAAGPIEGAYFAIAFTFAVALENLAVGLGIALTVEGSYDEEQLRSLLHRALTTGMPIMLLVCAGTAVAAPLLLLAFGGEYVEGATTVLRLLAIGALPQAILHLYVAAARVRHQSGRIMALQIALTVLVFASILALLPPFGLTGVGIGWVAAHGAVAALVLPGLLRVLWSPGAVRGEGVTEGRT